MTNCILTQAELKSQLHYDPNTGIFTRISCKNNPKSVGEVKNKADYKGYLNLKVNRCSYKSHRLAWLYMTGEWPKNHIDHINCIKTDNRFCNLREATNQQNVNNAGLSIRNSSGYKGVSWYKLTNRWVAKCCVDGVDKHLGYFPTAELASEAYKSFAKKTQGEFFRER